MLTKFFNSMNGKKEAKIVNKLPIETLKDEVNETFPKVYSHTEEGKWTGGPQP